MQPILPFRRRGWERNWTMEQDFEEKYRMLFRRYYAGLSFYAARLVGEEEAEDVVQDVFLEIWRRN